MRVPCPTCGRLGRVPKAYPDGAVIGYCGMNGERVPHETCQSCAGTGWVNDERAPIRSDAAWLNYGSKETLFDQVDRLVQHLRR